MFPESLGTGRRKFFLFDVFQGRLSISKVEDTGAAFPRKESYSYLPHVTARKTSASGSKPRPSIPSHCCESLGMLLPLLPHPVCLHLSTDVLLTAPKQSTLAFLQQPSLPRGHAQSTGGSPLPWDAHQQSQPASDQVHCFLLHLY